MVKIRRANLADASDIATLIHDYYFDVSRASTIARDLTSDAQSGMFDKLTIDAQNLSSLAVAVARARLCCDAKVDATTDAPLTVKLAGCHRTLHFG